MMVPGMKDFRAPLEGDDGDRSYNATPSLCFPCPFRRILFRQVVTPELYIGWVGTSLDP